MFVIKKKREIGVTHYSYEILFQSVKQIMTLSLRENPYEIVRTKSELDARIMFKKDLRKALKNCVVGDYHAKIFVLDFMKEIIAVRLKLKEEDLKSVFSFDRASIMTVQDKFDILLYLYKQRYGKDAFEKLMDFSGLDKPKIDRNGESYYEITEKDITSCYYGIQVTPLKYIDKLNIITQRIYQELKGNGAIDNLLELRLDGISGGVSGLVPTPGSLLSYDEKKTYSYNSIWVFYKGKSIRLSFLGFGSQQELIRICKNIYRYHNPGQLSEIKGYIVNEMADGSRIAVARPPFCESWVFFIRKFDSIQHKDMEHLLTDENKILPIMLIKWLVKGCQILAVTGEQGSGKTTLLLSMIQFINPVYNLRIQEQAFELNLRKVYPGRNIVSFQETSNINGQEVLEFQKKTDGTVNILGEVASLKVCSWLIQMGQAASSFTIFTHHAKTTLDLILYFRNALLQVGGFSSEEVAARQVATVLDFDIHMKKAADGHRYIDSITEIVKGNVYGGQETDQLFCLRELVHYENGKYVVKNILSEQAQKRILGQLLQKEKSVFLDQLKDWRDMCER